MIIIVVFQGRTLHTVSIRRWDNGHLLNVNLFIFLSQTNTFSIFSHLFCSRALNQREIGRCVCFDILNSGVVRMVRRIEGKWYFIQLVYTSIRSHPAAFRPNYNEQCFQQHFPSFSREFSLRQDRVVAWLQCTSINKFCCCKCVILWNALDSQFGIGNRWIQKEYWRQPKSDILKHNIQTAFIHVQSKEVNHFESGPKCIGVNMLYRNWVEIQTWKWSKTVENITIT